MKEKNARIPPSLGSAPCKSSSEFIIRLTAFFQGALLLPAGHLTLPPPPQSRVPVPGSSRCDLPSFSLVCPTPVDPFFAQNAAFKPSSAAPGSLVSGSVSGAAQLFQNMPPLRPYFKINNSQNRILEHLPHSSWKTT